MRTYRKLREMPRDAGKENNTPPGFEALHLLPPSLSGEKRAFEVNIEHLE